MEDDAKVEAFLNQCKINDVDVKVDALNKFQAECEAGLEITEPEPLINTFKTCLRTSNQHLTTATLSALPPLLPLLISRNASRPPVHARTPSASTSTSSVAPGAVVDVMTLRHVLTALLPSGGVLERLGDARDKPKEKARETLTVLGGMAFRSGGSGSVSNKKDHKGPETPLMIFERFLREGGLGSKVWKVREQSILTLVHIRRQHHLFPIRPYLPQLVAALEDTDPHVRECARTSVVELFTGPGVSDAARADLKKELTKKGVRKGIVDSVLSQVLSGANSNPVSEGSENGDAAGKPKQYVPPSVALAARRPNLGASTSTAGASRAVSYSTTKSDPSRPASRAGAAPSPIPSAEGGGSEVQAVYIASSRDLEVEFTGMIKHFEGKETEHNWAARERSIQRVRGMLKGDVHTRYMDVFLSCLRESFLKDSLKALASLRTTVAANTCLLYNELSAELGHGLDPFCELLLSSLLKMAGFTKKIAAQHSQASVTSIITNTSAPAKVTIPLLWNTMQDKNTQARTYAIDHIKHYLEAHGSRSRHSIENTGGVDLLEKAIKRALADTSPAVREKARITFWVFEGIWHDRGAAVIAALDGIARKQLEKACPTPGRAPSTAPSTPAATKKSSVAAAIAASRAKAKAIAEAPPTLRHQATSTSHATRQTSPPIQLFGTNARPGPSPPSSPRSRIMSAATTPAGHARSPSAPRSSSPPSPSASHSAFYRRASSPLAHVPPSPSRNSVFRVQTSPPRTPGSKILLTKPQLPRPSAEVPPEADDEESLLTATAIPLPEDSDSEEDAANLMSFSTPYEKYPPKPALALAKSPSRTPQLPGAAPSAPRSNSQVLSSPRSNDSVSNPNALSTNSPRGGHSEPIVEDALRARAEQAESAAERLLELVDPEEEGMHHSTIPSSLFAGSSQGKEQQVKPRVVSASSAHRTGLPPKTPLNKNAAILRQAALFKDSPVRNGSAGSLMSVLKDQKNETSWWLKRMSMVDQGTPLKTTDHSDRHDELEGYIAALERGDDTVRTLQKIATLCRENPAADTLSPSDSGLSMPTSPSPFITGHQSNAALHTDIWSKNKAFSRLFNALLRHLEPTQGESELEYGLIVLWEMLDHLAPYVEGREAEIFSVLLTVRYCNKLHVLEATTTIRDALTARLDPVYGLTTMHASIRAFQATPPPDFATAETKSASYAFGLVALGKFILRLPDEILEEELPRLKGTLINASNDRSSLVVRESAAAAIIAAQLVLRDETHLFALLDGLADEKKNLLTYLFDKHGARGVGAAAPGGMDRLAKEMQRLDTRTSTPPRV